MPEIDKSHILNSLIGVSVGAFLLGSRRGFVPIGNPPWYTYFSYSLNHANWKHLGLNMAMMWVVGSQLVESPAISTKQFGWLTLGAALGTSGLHKFSGSKIPILGASGIVFGFLGSVSLIDPWKTWLLLFPIPGVPVTNVQLVQVSVLSHAWMIMRKSPTNLALWGHLGGLSSGILLTAYMLDLPILDRDAYKGSLASWERSLSSCVLVLTWLAISVQLLLGFGDEATLISKKRFIKRTWRDDF